MKVYLAGKITNNPDYYINFLKAEVDVKSKYNCTVLNPAKTVARIEGLEHSEYMHICKAMIDVCDTVAFMGNWVDSKGAKIEHDYAEKLGKNIIYLEE